MSPMTAKHQCGAFEAVLLMGVAVAVSVIPYGLDRNGERCGHGS